MYGKRNKLFGNITDLIDTVGIRVGSNPIAESRISGFTRIVSTPFFRRRQNGLTLMEVMISMSLGLILCTILYSFFTMSYRQYQFIEQFAQMQEAGRFATTVLTSLIRNGGYSGCTQALSLEQNEYLQIHFAAENDVLFIQGMSANTVDLLQDMTSSRDLLVDDRIRFSSNDLYMISDCEKSDVFHPLFVQRHQESQSLKIDRDIKRFNRGAVVGKLDSRWIYVAETDRKNTTGQGIHALYLKNRNGESIEFVEGITKMHALFVMQENKISTVKIHLLLETNEAVLDGGIAKRDRRLYKPLEFTVMLMK